MEPPSCSRPSGQPPDPQGLCQRAKLEPALSNETQSHQLLWPMAGEGARSSRVGGGCLTVWLLHAHLLPSDCFCSPPPASASCPGCRSKDHNTSFPEIQSYSPDSWCGGLCSRAILPLRRPSEVQLPGYQVNALSSANSGWFGLQTRYPPLGRVSVNYAGMEAPHQTASIHML